MMPDREAKKFHIVSLGCPKNLVDSEVMAGILMRRGFRLTTDAREAGIIIINTCAFILPAKEEAIEAILTAATYKKTAACHRLIVAGCLPQRHGAELARAIPEVDLFIGTAEVPHIAEHLTGMTAPRYDGPDDAVLHGLFKNRRGLRKSLFLLHYSQSTRSGPEPHPRRHRSRSPQAGRPGG